MAGHKENARGICVVLNLIDTIATEPPDKRPRLSLLEDEISTVRYLFEHFNYNVEEIENKTKDNTFRELNKIKENIHKNHDSFVFFVIGEGDTEFRTLCDRCLQVFDDVFDDQLNGKPKIIIQHTLSGKIDTTANPERFVDYRKEIVSVFSDISGSREDALKTINKSIFVKRLYEICLRYGHRDDINELLKKVCIAVKKEQAEFPEHTAKVTQIVQISSTMAGKPFRLGKGIRQKLYFELLRESKKSGRYPMTSNPRGFCVIINITKNRKGSNIDEIKMETLFTELYFKTIVIRDESHKEIETRLKHIATQTSTTHNCLVIFLMAHGDEPKGKTHVFKDINDEQKQSTYIRDAFKSDNCNALFGKPKLFVIHTCFGAEKMKGVRPSPSVDTDIHTDIDMLPETGEKVKGARPCPSVDTDIHTDIDILPETDDGSGKTSASIDNEAHPMANFLTYRANLSGYVAFRYTKGGSPLIQAIDDIFRDYCADKHVIELLTKVNEKVGSKPIPLTNSSWMQPETYNNTWKKELYLNPGFKEMCIDNYNSELERCSVNGTTAWFTFDRQAVMVADLNSTDITQEHLSASDSEPSTFTAEEPKDLDVILQGVSLIDNRHVILVEDQDDESETRKCWIIATDSAVWRKLSKLEDILNPIQLCEIFLDGFGVFSNFPVGNNGRLHVYRRDEKTDALCNKPLHEVTFKYGRNNPCDIFQVIGESFTILRYKHCVILEFNLNGDPTKTINVYDVIDEARSPEGGYLFRPCGVFKNKEGNILVGCYDGLHVYTDRDWIFNKVNGSKRILHICCSPSHIVHVNEIHVDTSSVPRFPDTLAGIKSLQHIPTVKLDEYYGSLWTSDTADILLLGGDESTTISLISCQGVVLFRQKMIEEDGRITSGLCLGDNSYGIIIRKNESEPELRFINVQDKPYQIQFSDKSSSARQPVDIFKVNSSTYGVLCACTENAQACIKMCACDTTKVIKTINIGLIKIRGHDKACVDSKGNMYVMCNQTVREYDPSGALLEEINAEFAIKMTTTSEVWVSLFTNMATEFPVMQIMIDESDVLLILYKDGSIRRYVEGDWSLPPRFLSQTHAIAHLDNRICSVFEDVFKMYILVGTECQLNKEDSDTYKGILEFSSEVLKNELTPTITSNFQSTNQLYYSAVWAVGDVSVISYGIDRGQKLYIPGLLGPNYGVETSPLLSDQNARIHSAIYLGNSTHALIVWRQLDKSSFKLIFGHFDPNDPSNFPRKVTVNDQNPELPGLPVYIFHVDKNKYGVLIMSQKEHQIFINVYCKNSYNLVRSVKVAYTLGSFRDTACISPSGEIIVASYLLSCFHRFSPDGLHLDKVTLVDTPIEVHHDRSANIVITTKNGYIIQGKLCEDFSKPYDNIRSNRTQPIARVCYTGKRVYAVGENELSVSEMQDTVP